MNQTMLKKLLRHLTYMCCLSIALLYIFFYIALPYITYQGKIVKVPDLTGVHVEALDKYLKKYHLRHIITDNSGYSAALPPATVLQQFPSAGVSVKKNRAIYLTLNGANPPLVSMPNLIDASIKEAQLVLKNKGLKVGNVKYLPDITKHAVLEQWHSGHPILPGKAIHKGATIDLVVSAGLGTQTIKVPDMITISLEEARLTLLEGGMRIGVVHYVKGKRKDVGKVVQQSIIPGNEVRLGTAISLWVVK